MFFLQIEKIGLDSVKECQIDHISQASKQKSWFQNVFKSHNVGKFEHFKLKNEMPLSSTK